jgi:hypothetical protein
LATTLKAAEKKSNQKALKTVCKSDRAIEWPSRLARINRALSFFETNAPSGPQLFRAMSTSFFILCTLVLCMTACVASESVPTFVMLPLDVVSASGSLSNPQKLTNDLTTVKNVLPVLHPLSVFHFYVIFLHHMVSQAAHIDGFVADVWWGIVEGQGPKAYNWEVCGDL